MQGDALRWMAKDLWLTDAIAHLDQSKKTLQLRPTAPSRSALHSSQHPPLSSQSPSTLTCPPTRSSCWTQPAARLSQCWPTSTSLSTAPCLTAHEWRLATTVPLTESTQCSSWLAQQTLHSPTSCFAPSFLDWLADPLAPASCLTVVTCTGRPQLTSLRRPST